MDFNSQYQSQMKDVFRDIVREALDQGGDAPARARDYAERGKPDFVLAYLLAADLPDAEKRELLAHAYDRRAEHTETQARDFDRRFHRPFPLLFQEAANDRATAQDIRTGKRASRGATRTLPMV